MNCAERKSFEGIDNRVDMDFAAATPISVSVAAARAVARVSPNAMLRMNSTGHGRS
jgi:hypothetical protein